MLKIIWRSFTKRKILLFSLAVLLILLPLAYLTLPYGKKTEAAWIDDNYGYRQRVNIFLRRKLGGTTRGFFGHRFFKKGNINQKDNNHCQGKTNYHPRVKIPDIHSFFESCLANFLSLKATSKQTVASIKSAVNTKKLKGNDNPGKLGTIKRAPNQPADKLTKISDKTANKTGSSSTIKNTLAESSLVINTITI